MQKIKNWLFFIFIFLFNNNAYTSNSLNFSGIDNFYDGGQDILQLSYKDNIVLHKNQDNKVLAISRICNQPSKNFDVILPHLKVLNECSNSNIIVDSSYKVEKVIFFPNGDLARKFIRYGEEYLEETSYFYDQFGKLLRVYSKNKDIFIASNKTSVNIREIENSKVQKLYLRNKNLLGSADNFIIKNNNGKILLVVIDDIPFIPIVDKENSLRKILDLNHQEVASVKFSLSGKPVEVLGDVNIPICFKGMYKDIISGLYFNEKYFFDEDVYSYFNTYD